MDRRIVHGPRREVHRSVPVDPDGRALSSESKGLE
jgi:hypothetical protein